MITEQEKIVRKSQGYDIGFEHESKKYWINSDTWNEEKDQKLYEQTGLKSFREPWFSLNLVIYNPRFFEPKAQNFFFTNFQKCVSLVYTGDLDKNIPQPINMSTCYGMFDGCELQSLDLEDWDMSSVVNIEKMFKDCRNLENLRISTWDTSKITFMNSMFVNCISLTELDIHNWNASSLFSTRAMFQNCKSLIEMNLGEWSTPKLEDMSEMFRDCVSLQSIDLGGWDVGNITEASMMFYWCTSLENLNLRGWKPNDLELYEFAFANNYKLEQKYGTIMTKELVPLIVEDSNKKLGTLQAF